MQGKIKVLGLSLIVAFLFLGITSQCVKADILEDVYKGMPYINLEKVFQEYQKKGDIELMLEEETEVGRGKLEEMRQKLETLNREYAAQELLLTEAARNERQQEITQKITAIEVFRQEITNQIQEKQNQYTQEILQDIINKIEKVSEKEGYTYVFDKAALLYAVPSQDITERIITELNEEYEAGKNE